MSVNPQLRAVTDPADHMALTVKDMMTRLEAIERYIGTSVGPPWIPVTYQNGWHLVNYSLAYRKIGDIVYLRGDMGGGTNPGTVFTLPVGYRPPATETVELLVQGGLLGYAYVFPSGVFEHHGANNGGTETHAYFSTTP